MHNDLSHRLAHGSAAHRLPEWARGVFAERAIHAERAPGLLTGEVSVFFRPGDRTHPAHPNYHSPLSYKTLGVISVPGDSEQGIPPQFSALFSIRLSEQRGIQLRDLRRGDFEGAYAWIDSRESLVGHLNGIYPAFEGKDADYVTRYRFTRSNGWT